MTVESVSVVDPYSPGLSKSIAIVDRRRIPVTSLTWRLISSFANGKGTDAQAVQIEGDTIAIHRLVFFVIGLRIFLISCQCQLPRLFHLSKEIMSTLGKSKSEPGYSIVGRS